MRVLCAVDGECVFGCSRRRERTVAATVGARILSAGEALETAARYERLGADARSLREAVRDKKHEMLVAFGDIGRMGGLSGLRMRGGAQVRRLLGELRQELRQLQAEKELYIARIVEAEQRRESAESKLRQIEDVRARGESVSGAASSVTSGVSAAEYIAVSDEIARLREEETRLNGVIADLKQQARRPQGPPAASKANTAGPSTASKAPTKTGDAAADTHARPPEQQANKDAQTSEQPAPGPQPVSRPGDGPAPPPPPPPPPPPAGKAGAPSSKTAKGNAQQIQYTEAFKAKVTAELTRRKESIGKMLDTGYVSSKREVAEKKQAKGDMSTVVRQATAFVPHADTEIKLANECEGDCFVCAVALHVSMCRFYAPLADAKDMHESIHHIYTSKSIQFPVGVSTTASVIEFHKRRGISADANIEPVEKAVTEILTDNDGWKFVSRNLVFLATYDTTAKFVEPQAQVKLSLMLKGQLEATKSTYTQQAEDGAGTISSNVQGLTLRKYKQVNFKYPLELDLILYLGRVYCFGAVINEEEGATGVKAYTDNYRLLDAPLSVLKPVYTTYSTLPASTVSALLRDLHQCRLSGLSSLPRSVDFTYQNGQLNPIHTRPSEETTSTPASEFPEWLKVVQQHGLGVIPFQTSILFAELEQTRTEATTCLFAQDAATESGILGQLTMKQQLIACKHPRLLRAACASLNVQWRAELASLAAPRVLECLACIDKVTGALYQVAIDAKRKGDRRDDAKDYELDEKCTSGFLGRCCVSRICHLIVGSLSNCLNQVVKEVLSNEWSLKDSSSFVRLALPMKKEISYATFRTQLAEFHAHSDYGGITDKQARLLFMHAYTSPITALFVYNRIMFPGEEPRSIYATKKIDMSEKEGLHQNELPEDFAAVTGVCNATKGSFVTFEGAVRVNPMCMFFSEYGSKDAECPAERTPMTYNDAPADKCNEGASKDVECPAEITWKTYSDALADKCNEELGQLREYLTSEKLPNDQTIVPNQLDGQKLSVHEKIESETNETKKAKMALIALTLYALQAQKTYDVDVDSGILRVVKKGGHFPFATIADPRILISVQPGESGETTQQRLQRAKEVCISALQTKNPSASKASPTGASAQNSDGSSARTRIQRRRVDARDASPTGASEQNSEESPRVQRLVKLKKRGISQDASSTGASAQNNGSFHGTPNALNFQRRQDGAAAPAQTTTGSPHVSDVIQQARQTLSKVNRRTSAAGSGIHATSEHTEAETPYSEARQRLKPVTKNGAFGFVRPNQNKVRPAAAAKSRQANTGNTAVYV